MIVLVTDPDAPFDSPAYEGPADQAHTVFEPGYYSATVVSDDEELNGSRVLLRVTDNSSSADSWERPMDTYDVLLTETITYRYRGIISDSPDAAELAAEQLHLADTNRDRYVVAVDDRSMSATVRPTTAP
ncbi:hypothetical protein ACFV9C_41970 [Kribbella sp. NPDC059898]|uniref:hypothetical protein n=1 Tax=Kribbella sp. NPDC059898 TaxID=3346995 RepID=UPI00364B4A52